MSAVVVVHNWALKWSSNSRGNEIIDENSYVNLHIETDKAYLSPDILIQEYLLRKGIN